MEPMRAQLKPGWPTCDKCGNRWDPLMVMLTNCPKCGAVIPDAPMHQQERGSPSEGTEINANAETVRMDWPRRGSPSAAASPSLLQDIKYEIQRVMMGARWERSSFSRLMERIDDALRSPSAITERSPKDV